MQRRGKGSEDGLIDMDKVGMNGVKCIVNVSTEGDINTIQTLELVIDQKNVKCIHRGNAEQFVAAKKDHIGLAIVGNEVVAVSSTKLSQFPNALNPTLSLVSRL